TEIRPIGRRPFSPAPARTSSTSPAPPSSSHVRAGSLSPARAASLRRRQLKKRDPPDGVQVEPLESGRLTVPTVQTSFAGVDVEDGIEVLSTPKEPHVGLTFETWERAQTYYNKYARHAGFSIEIDTSKDSKRENEKRKTRCPARMIVRKMEQGRWQVVYFSKDHNHECVKKFSLTKYLASHRSIPPEEKGFIKFLHGCCITTTRAFQIMAELYGGIENCPYTQGDTKNLRLEYRAEYRGKDVKATLEYFEELKKEDPEFYYSYSLDEFDRVKNLFWVDGEARKAYELYSDCIPFDTTFFTNTYNMPCAPFIGIDRNSLTIQFGCGFLRNEKTAAFVWIFTEFKKAMGGRAPVNIITDQDLTMEAAIAEVFPETVHRNCRWHIMENARKVLGHFSNNKKDLASDFNDCVDNSFTTHEFEHKWQLMLDKHEIRDDERFRHLYDMRHRWVPAYFMLRFFPFLQATARSEGINAVLKKYVNPQNSILNFLHQYKKIQQRIFSKQIENEATTVVKVPHYLTGHPMEVQMKEAYTRKLFNMFQNELQLNSWSYYVVRVQGDELIDVVSYGTCPDKLYGSRTVRVASNKLDGMYSCECCKFQRDGVLCCHILKVFDALAVHEIPARYILARWSVEKMDGAENEEVAAGPLQAKEITEQGKHAIRYHAAYTKFSKIVRPFMIDDESHSIVLKHLDVMQHELAEFKKRKMLTAQGEVAKEKSLNIKTKKTKKVGVESNEAGSSNNVTQPDLAGGPKDPPVKKRQGRPRTKRYDGLKLRAKKTTYELRM
ncbi:hypothetical protein U9M48_018325, partial [Paspalum notatum var. saurae]